MKGVMDVTTVEVDLAPQGLGMGHPVNSGGRSNLCNGTARKQKIYVRLLLSIDRRESTESAMETVCNEAYREVSSFHTFERQGCK